MRILRPRQRTDGRWEMTVSSDEERWCHPAGYCAGWPSDDLPTVVSPELCEQLRQRRLPFRDKYHDDGHGSANLARACHREYELDQCVRVRHDPETQHKCALCGAWTNTTVEVGNVVPRRVVLCSQHQGRDDIEAALAA
jgi:hypothetical protein